MYSTVLPGGLELPLSMYMTQHHTLDSLEELPSVGSVTLTSNMQNCENLTRVSIPLQTTLRVSSYFIEFTNPTLIHWLHIAEVRFSDQPISTVTTATYDPTDLS